MSIFFLTDTIIFPSWKVFRSTKGNLRRFYTRSADISVRYDNGLGLRNEKSVDGWMWTIQDTEKWIYSFRAIQYDL